MAIIEHQRTGERKEIEGELPHGAIYRVEGYDDGEYWEEDRITIDGDEWIVIDDGVEMVSIDGPDNSDKE